MATVDRRLELAATLDELANLLGARAGAGPDVDSGRSHRLRVAVAELRRRLREDRIRILVVGESKRGKSTFTNALIGRPVLPMGVIPLTAVATTLTYGTPPGVQVSTRHGPERTEPLAALPDLVTEAGNPGNRLGLTAVVVNLDAPLLAEGIELVDTPGTGSVHQANTTEAEIAYQSMDAAIFVLSADPPISAAERELLERILPSSVATFVVLNKADRLTDSELRVAREFTARTVAEVAGRPLPIYVCSARQALGIDAAGLVLAGPNSSGPMVRGIDAFLVDFTEFLRSGRSSGLLTSLRRQGAWIVAQLLDEVTVTQRAAELNHTAGQRKVNLFRGQLNEVDRRQKDADDLVTGESQRLLAELNEDCERVEREVAGRISRALQSWLTTVGPLANADLEAQGHRIGSELIVQEVETWRSTRAGMLQKRLDELDARLRDGLDRDLADLRPAAKELLGIELTAEPADVALAPSQRFYYQFRIDLDAAGMLASGIRHRLPGGFGRTRAARYVLEQMDLLSRQQVGRARADLQERLATSTRSMRAALTERYADHSRRMLDALDAAADLVSADAAQRTTLLERLAARRQQLTSLRARMSVTEADGTAGVVLPDGRQGHVDGR